jgi:hypothetical protein
MSYTQIVLHHNAQKTQQIFQETFKQGFHHLH